MSWCRWSTDGFKCDLYIYESVGDFVSVNVAGRKKLFNVFPEPTAFTFTFAGGKCEVVKGWRWHSYTVRKKLWQWYYNVLPWREIKWNGGASHSFTDMESLSEWLLEARQNGLRFPDSVFVCCAQSMRDPSYAAEAV